MARIVQKVFRSLAYVLATGVILLALLVGLVRLLLPLAPEYQEEVRRVAAEATGLDVAFDRISASWPLRGPELTLFDVQLSDPETGLQVIGAQEGRGGIERVPPVRRGAPGAEPPGCCRCAGGRRARGGGRLARPGPAIGKVVSLVGRAAPHSRDRSEFRRSGISGIATMARRVGICLPACRV